MSTRLGQVEAANERLKAAFPELAPMFEALGHVETPRPRDEALCDAVVRIVAGQMLSSRAAQAIVQRLEAEAVALGCGLVDLPPERLAACGLSARKVRTITEFALAHRSSPDRFVGWGELAYESLRAEVRGFWGLSDWTAEMLAIFHFGHPDVFPSADGSIARASALVIERLAPTFDPGRAAPNRTLLAAYLWASLDRGYWREADGGAA